MALVAKPIVSVIEAKSLVRIDGATDDALFLRAIKAVSSRIEKHCNRTFGEQTGIVEYHGGDTQAWTTLIPRCRPLTSTTAVDLRVDLNRVFGSDTLLVEDTDFVVDAELGLIDLVGAGIAGVLSGMGRFPTDPKTIKLTYSAGYTVADMPYEAKLAAAMWAGMIHQKLVEQNGLLQSSKQIMDGSVDFIQGMPEDVMVLLEGLKFSTIG